MRKAAILIAAFLLLSLGFSQVSPSQSDEFMEKLITAFNTDNYSLIEPYMSEELKGQFTEGYFHQIREFTLNNYGRLKGYRLTSRSEEGELLKYEYQVTCEKGSFPVLLAYRGGELVGIALGVKAKPNPLGMVLMILGSLVSLGAIYLWKGRIEVSEFVMGAGIALGLGIILPFYSLITLGLSRTAGVLTAAFLTALTVEGSKYYFSRKGDGLSLGLGFGVGKYVFLSIGTFVATNFILKLPVSFSGGELYAFLEALLLTAFHGLTAMLYSSRRIGYLAIFAVFQFVSITLTAFGEVGLAMVVMGAGLILALYLGVKKDGVP